LETHDDPVASAAGDLQTLALRTDSQFSFPACEIRSTGGDPRRADVTLPAMSDRPRYYGGARVRWGELRRRFARNRRYVVNFTMNTAVSIVRHARHAICSATQMPVG